MGPVGVKPKTRYEIRKFFRKDLKLQLTGLLFAFAVFLILRFSWKGFGFDLADLAWVLLMGIFAVTYVFLTEKSKK